MAVLLTLVGRTLADNLTVADVTLNAGDKKQVSIVLNNPDHQYAAFQFDLVLPEGVSIAKNAKGKLMASLNEDRQDDHTLTVTDVQPTLVQDAAEMIVSSLVSVSWLTL